MPVDRWFNLSVYVTLGLSCVGLVFAEAFFLPGLPICLAPVLALLAVAWWVEGRWSLPAWGANVLGVLIAGGGVTWLAMQFADNESWLARVPMPLAVLPYTGPLLMATLLVRVFRPRAAGDFWRLQGLGLLQIGLGCVLAGGPEFGVVLVAYLASGLVCLGLHYRLDGAETRSSLRSPTPSLPPQGLLPFTLRWTLLISTLAVALFLITPRQSGSTWEPLQRYRPGRDPIGRLQIGLSEEINLNHTGTLVPDDEVALQVEATDKAGQPRQDLSPGQRWRGRVLDWYESGKWRSVHQPPLLPPSFRRPVPQTQLPEPNADSFYVTFTVLPRRAGGLVLAEPIRLGTRPNRLPVASVPGRRSPLFVEMSGTVLPLVYSSRREYCYRQIVSPGPDPERFAAESLREGAYLERLTRQPVAGLHTWTVDVLRRLADQPAYPLPEEVRAILGQRGFVLEAQHWEPVARALTHYLANSGEFTYSLEITRHDRNIDPVMDFLVNLKQGHCERYATALALMLRSLGVPTRVVKGYRGADDEGDGVYVIRHSHAHAWVEILIPRNDPSQPVFDWLTLDPTPAASASRRTAFSLAHWWQDCQRNLQQFWQTLIIDYSADEQADLWDRLNPLYHLPELQKLGLLLVAVLIGLVALLVVRRLLPRRRSSRARAAEVEAFYARLLALLARHAALRPQSTQTPREFGARVRQLLQARPSWAAVADLPGQVIELFYRVRFGGRPLSTTESRAIGETLDLLARQLSAHA